MKPDAARRELFRSLYEANYATVLAFALRRLPGREDAEDVTAETFQIAWRRLDEIPRRPRAWLLAVARHRSANRVRESRHRRELAGRLERWVVPPDDSSSEDDRREEALDILAALSTLEEAEREVIVLVAWDCLSYREAAQVLGVSVRSFAMRLLRARRTLTRALAGAAERGDGVEVDLPSVKEKS